jgi:hypothetical protein
MCLILITGYSQVRSYNWPGLVLHICNSSYSGGRGRQGGGYRDPISKTKIKTKGLGAWLTWQSASGQDLGFNFQYWKKKNSPAGFTLILKS